MKLRTAGIIGGGAVLVVVLLAAAATAGIASLLGGTLFAAVTPSAQAQAEIPSAYLQLFRSAAVTCPGLPWTVLAGIGRAETDFGADTQVSAAGAEGVMQFMPSTFAAYDEPVPSGGADPPTPFDPTDAVFAAARDLCANGARNGADIPAAIYAYNHSQTYVGEVLSYAASYTGEAPQVAAPSTAGADAVAYALDQIGTPYRWGGETPGVGFDCSGLTQAAYAAAGITIPRTSEAQWADLPHVPLGQLEPGDLLFFDPGEFLPGLPGHVGVYIGNNEMIDAPRTGADVRIENLAAWPDPMGAARPSAGQTGA